MSEAHPSPTAGATAAQATQVESTTPKRILLVEGDGFTRLVLLLRLRLAGFGVDFTSNGIIGLGKLRSCHPDILLVELKLCGLHGLDLIKAARAEPAFGDRPIYVYTHADKMNRTTRKEVAMLATQLFDKSSTTREELVQTFAEEFLGSDPGDAQPVEQAGAELPAEVLSKVVPPRAIQELVAGVREQSRLLAACDDAAARTAAGIELLSRVCSLASCAEVAGVPNLARQAKALKNFLEQLCKEPSAYTAAALTIVTRAVDLMVPMAFEFTGKTLTRFTTVVLDEEPRSNKAIKEGLLQAGFDPVSFEDPARARQHLAANGTELIIINVSLPEAHGLALADVRQLPWHAETPVIFGPEPILIASHGDELPTSAPRLDKKPLLLAELVVRALNEVQAIESDSATSTVSALPTLASAREPLAETDASSEDVFELFARTPGQHQVAALASPLRNIAVGPEEDNQSLAWSAESLPEENAIQERLVQPVSSATNCQHPANPLFAWTTSSNGSGFRAEPSTNGEELEAELLTQLPTASIDGSQPDERPIEGPSDSALQPPTEPPQSEPTLEGKTAAEWFAAAASESGASYSGDNEDQLEANEPPAVQEPSEETPTNEEFVKNQFNSARAEHAAPGEAAQQPPDSLNDRKAQREDLAARICEAEMELYRVRSELEERDKAIQDLQKQLTEARTVKAHSDQQLAAQIPAGDSEAGKEAQARCVQLEQELAALRQVFEDFSGNFAQDQQAAAEADQRVGELKQRLAESEAELEKQREQQRKEESELRRQLELTTATHDQSDAARQRAETKCAKLEQELAELNQKRQEKSADGPATEQKTGPESSLALTQSQDQISSGAANSGKPATELEQQVVQGVAALARATAELAKERGERQRSEQRAAELSARMQTLHEDFGHTLQAQRDNLARISALEEQQRQTDEALARRTADVEQQQAERRLAEEQLRKAKEVNAQIRKDLSFFDQANHKFDGARQDMQSRLEASLSSARENESRLQRESAERERLAESLEGVQRELATQSRKREVLESELQIARDALQERGAKLQKEAAERQRVSESLDCAQRDLRDRSGRGDLEFSKLESALNLEQVERKRLEAQYARLRHNALDAAHAARALRTSLRRQIREPADNLVHSARRLLELEMGEEQTKLAEAVLQDVLLVQTRLREPEMPHRDSPEPDAEPSATPT